MNPEGRNRLVGPAAWQRSGESTPNQHHPRMPHLVLRTAIRSWMAKKRTAVRQPIRRWRRQQPVARRKRWPRRLTLRTLSRLKDRHPRPQRRWNRPLSPGLQLLLELSASPQHWTRVTCPVTRLSLPVPLQSPRTTNWHRLFHVKRRRPRPNSRAPWNRRRLWMTNPSRPPFTREFIHRRLWTNLGLNSRRPPRTFSSGQVRPLSEWAQ
jgi:hypothetical protein